jgi:hypothetical protein
MLALVAHKYKILIVMMVMVPILDNKQLCPLFTNVLGMLPELILFPLWHPSLDQNKFRILSTVNC